MIRLQACPKAFHRDQDKAVAPEQTVARVRQILAGSGQSILAETRRIDTGRLDIPVFLSVCGEQARAIMPTRKQMGKGASPAQAEASALMELVERYSFFTFWENPANFRLAAYSEAEAWAGDAPVMDLAQTLLSVGEELDRAQARKVMDLVRWRFCLATDLAREREEWVPLDWFKKLGEFNGSSDGNTTEETLLQSACEVVARHVCDLVDRHRPTLPTIDLARVDDPVLAELLAKFHANGVEVIFKDFTLGMPVPTIGVIAWDPCTHPGLSEIVFTAGTASSPAKAAIRALTEAAQLAGDFHTGAVYEASGLPKFATPREFDWLRAGDKVALASLPTLEHDDIRNELAALATGLGRLDRRLYGVDISNPELGLAAHYSFAPGFGFRERDRNPSLGLFVGRLLAEEADPAEALAGLTLLAEVYPGAHFLSFFEGMVLMRAGSLFEAAQKFEASEPVQPDAEKQAMAAFYGAYSLTQVEDWRGAVPGLNRAIALCPEVKEYFNLRGVARFKQGKYAEAAEDFGAALDIDRGSAMDLANLGMCHSRMGHRGKAVDFLDAALALDPSLSFARAELAGLSGERD